jgi:hypothetical protein
MIRPCFNFLWETADCPYTHNQAILRLTPGASAHLEKGNDTHTFRCQKNITFHSWMTIWSIKVKSLCKTFVHFLKKISKILLGSSYSKQREERKLALQAVTAFLPLCQPTGSDQPADKLQGTKDASLLPLGLPGHILFSQLEQFVNCCSPKSCLV